MHWQWREDREPGDPWTNMAVDQALFDALVRGEAALPTVRLYRWDRPAVSIGRLQDSGEVQAAYPHLPVVRRPTGGRAVVHGNDLTVSVVTRAGWLPGGVSGGVLSSYRQIVSGLLRVFRALGIDAVLGPAHPEGTGTGSKSVDCFHSTARCDLRDAVTGRKLAGCAQRRAGGVILQQMSIPLAGLPGEPNISDCIKREFPAALGIEAWGTVDSAHALMIY